MKRIVTLFILMLLVVTAVPVGVAQAQIGNPTNRTIAAGEVVNEDVEVYGGNLIIESGAMVNGDIVVFGGHAEVDGVIDGDVAIFGGDVELSGNVVGDLVVFGGNMDLSDMASVDGDCALLGGTVSGEGAGRISCTAVAEEFSFSIGDIMGIPPIAPIPDMPEIQHPQPPEFSPSPFAFVGRAVRDVFEAVGSSVMVGLIALIVAALLPNQLNQVSDVIVRKPVASGTVGVLTAMAGPFAIALLAAVSGVLILLCGLGLLGFPVVFVLSVALAFGFLLGWIAVGTLFGQRLAEALKLSNRSLPVAAALGTGLLTLLTSLMGVLPFLGEFFGGLVVIIVGSAGLGAVALTKFGTRNYPLGLSNEDKVAAVLETLPVEEA